MADYYINNGGVNPFVAGAAMGFELIDRAYDRRRQAADRQRALQLEDERMAMAREDQDMQKKQFTMAEEDRDLRLAQEQADRLKTNRLEAGSALGELAAIHNGLDKAPRAEVIALTRKGDPTRYASASDDDVYAGAQSLMLEGSDYAGQEAIRQRQREEQWTDRRREIDYQTGVRAAEQRRVAQGLAGVYSLVGGADEPAAPALPPTIIKDSNPTTGGQRGGASRGAAGATVTGQAPAGAAAAPPKPLFEQQQANDAKPRGKTTWELLTAKPDKAPTNPWAQSKWLPIANGAPGGAAARRNPETVVDDWLRDRDSITNPKVRGPLDELATVGIQRRIETLRGQPGSAPEIARLEDQARKLSRDAATAKVVDAAPRPLPPGDAAAKVVSDAAAVQSQTGLTPKATQEQFRVLQAQTGRMIDSPPKRFTPKQLDTIAYAVAVGALPADVGMNLVMTGQATKPEKAVYHNAGEGRFLVTRGDKVVGMIDASGAPVTDSNGRPTGNLKDTERRLRHGANSEFALKQMNMQFDDGAFDPLGFNPSRADVTSGFFQALDAARPELESRYKLALTDPTTGGTTLGHLGQGEVATLIDWYTKHVNKGGKGSLADYGPATAAQSGGSDDGWSVTPVN